MGEGREENSRITFNWLHGWGSATAALLRGWQSSQMLCLGKKAFCTHAHAHTSTHIRAHTHNKHTRPPTYLDPPAHLTHTHAHLTHTHAHIHTHTRTHSTQASPAGGSPLPKPKPTLGLVIKKPRESCGSLRVCGVIFDAMVAATGQPGTATGSRITG